MDTAGMKRIPRRLACVILLFVACGTSFASGPPAWAYPVNPPRGVPVPDDERPQRVPDSPVVFTRAQIAAITVQVPDWHPDEHPPMPDIVAKSREPAVFACGYCHLPNGAGRPENTSLAGLPPAYIRQQMTAFRIGARQGAEPARLPQNFMIALAKAVTEAEIEAAAAYFSALKPLSFVRVVEAAHVPKTIVAGWTLTLAPGGGTEPLGDRIVEMPEDFARFENRDSRTTYVAYVPVGSIRRGGELVATGGAGKTLPCAACHGPELKGMADVPRLAGRAPGYLMRQLYDIQAGRRSGGASELMKPVVANLTEQDMIALVAYLASCAP
jgi:cytochrome c553